MRGGSVSGDGVGSSVIGGRVAVDMFGEGFVSEALREERDLDIESRVGRGASSAGESGRRGSSRVGLSAKRGLVL